MSGGATVAMATPRRQSLLTTTATAAYWTAKEDEFHESSPGKGVCSRMGEAAGGCAAVCCCCPCAMAHLLILMLRLPAAIWRGKRRRKRRLLMKRRSDQAAAERNEGKQSYSIRFYAEEGDESFRENDAVVVDNQVWERFYMAGFWRSGSRRADVDD